MIEESLKFINLTSIISEQSQNKQYIELRGTFQIKLTLIPAKLIFIWRQLTKDCFKVPRYIEEGLKKVLDIQNQYLHNLIHFSIQFLLFLNLFLNY